MYFYRTRWEIVYLPDLSAGHTPKSYTNRSPKFGLTPTTLSAMAASSWFVYLIRTRHNTLYTGITTDVAQRLQAHTNGRQGAKYLRAKGPLSLVYQVELGNRSLAAKAEYHIKKLTKSRKEEIITNQLNSQDLLTLLNIQTTES